MVAERNRLAEETITELLDNIEKLKKERKQLKDGYSKIKDGMDKLLQVNVNQK